MARMNRMCRYCFSKFRPTGKFVKVCDSCMNRIKEEAIEKRKVTRRKNKEQKDNGK